MSLGGRCRGDVIYENDSGTNGLLSVAGYIQHCLPAGAIVIPKGIDPNPTGGGRYLNISENNVPNYAR